MHECVSKYLSAVIFYPTAMFTVRMVNKIHALECLSINTLYKIVILPFITCSYTYDFIFVRYGGKKKSNLTLFAFYTHIM